MKHYYDVFLHVLHDKQNFLSSIFAGHKQESFKLNDAL